MEYLIGIRKDSVRSGLTNKDVHNLGNTTHDLADNNQAAAGQSNPTASKHI